MDLFKKMKHNMKKRKCILAPKDNIVVEKYSRWVLVGRQDISCKKFVGKDIRNAWGVMCSK